jgi:N,N-dimethylformamidase beta subunit-like protein/uncharacterized protein DUF4082/Big-like domain-containing protein/purple acid phosphatase-like protein
VTAPSASAAPCDPPVTSEIACENSKPGTPPSVWDISGSGSSAIQGFATDISVDQGETVRFKVDTAAADYRLDIYRMGWYGGDGARKVATVQPSALNQFQPDCLSQASTGLVDCGNWTVSASWAVPGDAVSGVYIAHLVREDLFQGESHIPFVVRDDDGQSDVLFQTSDSTWQAYNEYGGNSLYTGAPAGRAYKVSYNRPFTTRGDNTEDAFFNAEYPMVRWLERNGYDVSYFTNMDAHRRGAELLEHDAFLSVGHDEYWSASQRASAEAARAAGVNLAFFSGNEVFWKTRWEPSIDGSGTANRTLVSYKETHAGIKIDPEPGVWTGTWRDPRFSPPADGGRPENALTGQLFTVNAGATTEIQVPAADGRMRFWRNTSVATLAAGSTATLGDDTLGYEWDSDVDNGHRPPGAFRLSSTTVPNAPVLQDHGSSFSSGTATHNMTLYRHPSDALVFGAGTVQWSWGLDDEHDRGSADADPRMQQATVNLLADMHVQPATLQNDLAAATASSDETPPSAAISSPAPGATGQVGTAITISGTATDGEAGGRVAGVEVSTDGGQSWRPATGRADWTYSWTPTSDGAVTLRARAVDDSGNVQTTPATVTVDVVDPTQRPCPCSIFDPAATPTQPDNNDGQPIEIGVKFRSDVDGYITALRFYKGASNTGTHVGHLWSATGQKLAEATFVGESASGWQRVTLGTPVPIAGNTTYVASYHSSAGGYAASNPFFVNNLDNPPLHALRNGLDGGNGVYRYGASSFPTQSYDASNYWVDVVFERDVAPDTTPPAVASVTPPDGTGDADPAGLVTATFNEELNPATATGATFTLRNGAGSSVPASVSYDLASSTLTLDPSSTLAPGTTYTATVKGGPAGVADRAGNRLPQDRTWSFEVAPPPSCPCTIFPPGAAPAQPDASDNRPIEVGVKFRADEDGYITGIRFYKGASNTGTHVGHLWSSTGRKRAEATFTSETASGWQQVMFQDPVWVAQGRTYVASYHSPTGGHALDDPYFGVGVDRPPLHALANGIDGGNGVYRYGASGFPTQSFNASNYWVDVVFERDVAPDTTPPQVTSDAPVDGVKDVEVGARVSASFNEALDPDSVNGSTFTLRSGSGAAVPAQVAYDLGDATATLTPNQPLAHFTTYTATLEGGPAGIADRSGNRLAQDHTWSFETEPPPPPPPTSGPGGPILAISSPADPFSQYYAEILRAEGLNAFTVATLPTVTPAVLASHQVAILPQTPLSDAQAAMLATWVNGGGNLIAMRPDKKLASLLGLTDAGTTLPEAYLRVDTASSPGEGITGQTMQYHGTADRYALNGARAVATLYSNAQTATSNPAVTLRSVGTQGGQAASFTYDLARSVVYTRQGNPAWSGQERDGLLPIRSDDLFYGALAGNPQPDWVDLDKVAVPQADEQQRLLANLITEMNRDRTPLPRFWYLPRGEKAAVVMTGDDHGSNGTVGQFEHFKTVSPTGCSVADWECIRGTSYLFSRVPLPDSAARDYEAQGFELALHVNTNCDNFDLFEFEEIVGGQLGDFAQAWPSLSAPRTNRNHCISFADWASVPKGELSHGIRFDTTYYWWPAAWVQNRPGMFTGSGMPMRFADLDGTMIDVYQAPTQLTDESGQDLPMHIRALLDNALGPQGYYGVFTTNMHTDHSVHAGANAIVAEAQARGVPVVTARQMLDWLDGRNASSFGGVSFSGNQLSFTVDRATRARGLVAMVPTDVEGGSLVGLTRGGAPVATTRQVVKGVRYDTFDAAPGSYVATYDTDTTPPAISGVGVTARDDGTATVAWQTNEASTTRVDYGLSPDSLTSQVSDQALVTSHTAELTGLIPGRTYHYRVTSADDARNSATSPSPPAAPAAFGTPAFLLDTTVADFAAGTRTDTYAGASGAAQDGEVQLNPTVGEEFNGPALPADWTVTPWATGGTGLIADSALTVDGARAGTTPTYGPDRSVEFVATLGATGFRHVGLGVDYNNPPWTIFSTGGGSLATGLWARSSLGGNSNTQVTGIVTTAPHRYRIDWTPTTVQYFVDGTLVATHARAITTPMRPLASDLNTGGGNVPVHWLRMSPYATAGTFTSRVLDAGAVADWGRVEAGTTLAAGTGLTLETRSGDTATPDASWSAWQPAASGSDSPSPNARYIQYRASLTTGSTRATPTLDSVRIRYSAAP